MLNDYGGFCIRLKSESETTVDFYCDGFKIIPGRERRLDGFKPELTFFVDPNSPAEIKVACFLVLEGPDFIKKLVEPTFLYYLDINKKATCGSLIGGKILFAPVTQVGEFLTNMRALADFIGNKIELLDKPLPADPIDVYKGFRAQNLLEVLGIKV